MEKLSKINPFMSNMEMKISDELDGLPYGQLEKVKIYLTKATLEEINKCRNYNPYFNTLYGVRLSKPLGSMILENNAFNDGKNFLIQ